MPISLLYDNITSTLVNNRVCAAIYLDFSKAFDTVNHSILIKKLEKYGIRNTESHFFLSYLSDRKQSVKYNTSKSTVPKTMTLGVPQGSVLGPLLFLMYINDLKNCSDLPDYLIFADDSLLYYESENLHQLQISITQSLPDIVTWLNCNRLTINVKKCNYQVFGISNKPPDLEIHINNQPLKRNFSVKYLGLLIDEDLRWNSHIRAVENTVSRNIGLINRAKHILNSNHILMLYNALILPALNYCLQIWGSSYQSKFSKLITLQKKVIRIIDHAEYLAHTSPIFKKYNLLKFTDLTTYVQLNVMHSFVCNQLTAPLAEKLEYEPTRVIRAVRLPRHFLVPFGLTNYRQFSLFISAPDRWNTFISANIRDINDVPLSQSFFKKVAKKIFIDKY